MKKELRAVLVILNGLLYYNRHVVIATELAVVDSHCFVSLSHFRIELERFLESIDSLENLSGAGISCSQTEMQPGFFWLKCDRGFVCVDGALKFLERHVTVAGIRPCLPVFRIEFERGLEVFEGFFTLSPLACIQSDGGLRLRRLREDGRTEEQDADKN